jgi:hypothetical protein
MIAKIREILVDGVAAKVSCMCVQCLGIKTQILHIHNLFLITYVYFLPDPVIYIVTGSIFNAQFFFTES